MRAVDTNVVVRLVARDDAKQVAAAEEYISKGAWVSLLVLQETMWVLERAYALSRGQQAKVVELLMEHQSLILEAPNILQKALEGFRNSSGVGFADCLVLASAQANGHTPLGTFDKKLARMNGVEIPV